MPASPINKPHFYEFVPLIFFPFVAVIYYILFINHNDIPPLNMNTAIATKTATICMNMKNANCSPTTSIFTRINMKALNTHTLTRQISTTGTAINRILPLVFCYKNVTFMRPCCEVCLV